MHNDSRLKITVMSNKPSEQAIRDFQKKLHQLHKSNVLKTMSGSANNSKTAKKQ